MYSVLIFIIYCKANNNTSSWTPKNDLERIMESKVEQYWLGIKNKDVEIILNLVTDEPFDSSYIYSDEWKRPPQKYYTITETDRTLERAKLLNEERKRRELLENPLIKLDIPNDPPVKKKSLIPVREPTLREQVTPEIIERMNAIVERRKLEELDESYKSSPFYIDMTPPFDSLRQDTLLKEYRLLEYKSRLDMYLLKMQYSKEYREIFSKYRDDIEILDAFIDSVKENFDDVIVFMSYTAKRPDFDMIKKNSLIQRYVKRDGQLYLDLNYIE